jgi:hypothetical protein
MIQGNRYLRKQGKLQFALCLFFSMAAFGLGWILFSESGHAEEAKTSVPALDEHYEQKPITVTVSKTLYLPPDMYGQWSVTGDMLESNAPEQFSHKLSDIWILEREGDQVIVSNPATGASANISVDKVEGETATFHRMNRESRTQVLEEIPTITVHGDTMTGIMLNRVSKFKNGTLIPISYVKYQLQAQRIGGARVQFSPSNDAGGERYPGAQPDLRIEPMRFIKGPKKQPLD